MRTRLLLVLCTQLPARKMKVRCIHVALTLCRSRGADYGQESFISANATAADALAVGTVQGTYSYYTVSSPVYMLLGQQHHVVAPLQLRPQKPPPPPGRT